MLVADKDRNGLARTNGRSAEVGVEIRRSFFAPFGSHEVGLAFAQRHVKRGVRRLTAVRLERRSDGHGRSVFRRYDAELRGEHVFRVGLDDIFPA